MNVQLSAAQVAELVTTTLTKREKLLHLARILRGAPIHLFMFSNVEYMSAIDKQMTSHPYSAFALAAADPILKDAGLTGSSVADGERFFELTRDELHAFSCDCGGHISNDQMARRVDAIAARNT